EGHGAVELVLRDVAGDDERHGDVRKHGGDGIGTPAFHLDAHALDLLLPFAQDHHHVHATATGEGLEEQLHGSHAGVHATERGRAVDGDGVATIVAALERAGTDLLEHDAHGVARHQVPPKIG